MSEFYNAQRKRNLFDPKSKKSFRLSRSKLELFKGCPLCFYLDRRLGVARPDSPPFNLNLAVDKLLKKEFDIYRAAQTAHPIMVQHGLNLVPFQHEKMEEWRDALRRGIQYLHKPTNLLITGGIDDIWATPLGLVSPRELFIADYKATAKQGEVNLDAEWQKAYKRQMEIYQWLFRMNMFKVSNTSYFVYCNGNTDKERFGGKLEFSLTLLPYEGDDSWVEQVIVDAHKCLMSDELPSSGDNCDFCDYRKAIEQHRA